MALDEIARRMGLASGGNTEEARPQALRYNEGKPELHWVDAWPRAMDELARVFQYGAEKYGAYNYKKGAPMSESYNCARRHMKAWLNGETVDPESGKHHLAHAMWNIGRLLDEDLCPGPGTVDDRPHTYLMSVPTVGRVVPIDLHEDVAVLCPGCSSRTHIVSMMVGQVLSRDERLCSVCREQNPIG